MEIDRRAFIASLGGTAAVSLMDSEAKADSLEHWMEEQLDEQVAAVRRTLEEIGAANLPEVLALNKIDAVRGSERARLARRYPGSVAVSALTGEGVDGLLEKFPAMAQTPAGINERIIAMNDDLVLSFGTRTPAVVNALAVALYAPDSL